MNRLPEILNTTDIVLELRDSRLPLTSINPQFEDHLKKWKGKAKESNKPGKERMIILNKADLTPGWGQRVWLTVMARCLIHGNYLSLRYSFKLTRASIPTPT